MSYDYIIHEEDYKGFTIKIVADHDPLNPLDEDSDFGKMVCWHRRYDLGHEQPKNDPESYMVYRWLEHGTNQELREMIVADLKRRTLSEAKNLFHTYGNDYQTWVEYENLSHPSKNYPESLEVLPLYLYDHSGISISTGSFSCPWDSGQVGFIYVTREQIIENYGDDSPESREKARKLMESEVKGYDQYLRGDVWGFVIEGEDEDEVHSVWGFYGDDYCLEEARQTADFYAKEREKELDIVRENQFDNHFVVIFERT